MPALLCGCAFQRRHACLLSPPHHGVAAAPLELAAVLPDYKRHVLLLHQREVACGHGVGNRTYQDAEHSDLPRQRQPWPQHGYSTGGAVGPFSRGLDTHYSPGKRDPTNKPQHRLLPPESCMPT